MLDHQQQLVLQNGKRLIPTHRKHRASCLLESCNLLRVRVGGKVLGKDNHLIRAHVRKRNQRFCFGGETHSTQHSAHEENTPFSSELAVCAFKNFMFVTSTRRLNCKIIVRLVTLSNKRLCHGTRKQARSPFFTSSNKPGKKTMRPKTASPRS